MGSIPVGSTKNDCEDSRFFNPDSESKDGVPSSRFPYARRARCYTGVPKRLSSQSFLYDEEKGLTIQNAQRVFGNKF